MKKKKLNLEELKLESFVTSFENSDKNTVKGGIFSIIFCKPDNRTNGCSISCNVPEGCKAGSIETCEELPPSSPFCDQ